MWTWAMRDMGRHPVFSVLLFLVLTVLTALTGLWLLLGLTISGSMETLMQQAPAVVVRRVSPMGWMPLPVDQAMESATALVGVLNPRTRIWGVVAHSRGPVTIIGLDPNEHHPLPEGFTVPHPGQALVGPGLDTGDADGPMILQGVQSLTLTVVGHLPLSSSMATHDVVVVHSRDARTLLGLAVGWAGDLALDVYHETEIPALSTALAQAFPWPVHIATRPEAIRLAREQITQRTGLGLAVGIPIGLAFILLVMALGVQGHGRRWETGLLQAMGWTTGDLVRLKLYSAMLAGLPAVSLGMALAYGLIHWPAMTWVPVTFFQWTGPPPAIYLSVARSAWGFILGAFVVGLPYFTASLWTAWQGVQRDPGELLAGGP